MATRVWQGGASAVTEVRTATVGTVAIGNVAGVTIGTKTVSTVAASTTPATVAAALLAALQASQEPEFTEVIWSVLSAVITGTMQTTGRPFALAAAGTGGVVTVALVTAATGENHADDVLNYSGAALPGAADTLAFAPNAPDMLYGLGGITGALTAVSIPAAFVGSVGLPARNQSGYTEYRTRFLALAGTPAVTVGDGPGGGSGRLNLAIAGAGHTVTCLGTANANDPGGYALNLTNGGGGGNTLVAAAGSVGVATEAGQTATYATVKAGQPGNNGGTLSLGWGAGATITTVDQDAGDIDAGSAPSGTLTMYRDAGTFTLDGGSLTAVQYGGRLVYAGSGTLTVNADGPTAVTDLSRSPVRKVLAGTSSFLNDAVLYDPGATRQTNDVLFDDGAVRASTLGPRVTVKAPP